MRRSLPTRALLRTVNLYQRLTAHRPSPCRYVPSCSEYAREALEIHGAARGSWLSARRLSRCHPFGGFGFDPVPQHDTLTHDTLPRDTAVSGRA